MNILFIAHFPHLYGSIRSSLDLADGLHDLGITPFFIIPADGTLSKWLEDHQIQFEILPVPCWMSDTPLNFVGQIQKAKEISRAAHSIGNLIQQWKIDLVYTNTSIIPVGRLAARREHIPHIWHIREFGALDFSLQYIFPKSLSKAFIRSSDAVICHANSVRDHHFRQNTPRVYQIYNGCATKAQFDERLQARIDTALHAEYIFAMLSVITPKKGQQEAIRASGELRRRGFDVRLIIAGNGKADYLEHLRQLINENQLSDVVEFTGLLDDPFPVYYRADCVLICSEHEALSRVGLEAMSTALPLIGRNSGGNPEIIVDRETGYLYNSFDGLVEYMTRLVQKPDLGRQMGLKGWQRAKQMFNIEDYAANVYQVIQSVMNR